MSLDTDDDVCISYTKEPRQRDKKQLTFARRRSMEGAARTAAWQTPTPTP